MASEQAVSQLRLDRPTLLAGLLSLAFLLGAGWLCTLLPPVAGFQAGELLQKILPFATAGLFPLLRQSLAARRAQSVGAETLNNSAYEFYKYAIVAALLIFALWQLLGAITGAIIAASFEALRTAHSTLDERSFRETLLIFNVLFMIYPLVILLAAYLGWIAHRHSIVRPLRYVFTIFLIVLLLRLVDYTFAMWALRGDGLIEDMLQRATTFLSGFVGFFLGVPIAAAIAIALGYAARALLARIGRLFNWSVDIKVAVRGDEPRAG
jgi:hypothetical protein